MHETSGGEKPDFDRRNLADIAPLTEDPGQQREHHRADRHGNDQPLDGRTGKNAAPRTGIIEAETGSGEHAEKYTKHVLNLPGAGA